MRGCREEAPAPVFDLDGEIFNRCPRTYVTPEVADLLRLYTHYDKGFLPVAGGVLDQTPQYLAAMSIIAAEVAEQERRAWAGKKS